MKFIRLLSRNSFFRLQPSVRRTANLWFDTKTKNIPKYCPRKTPIRPEMPRAQPSSSSATNSLSRPSRHSHINRRWSIHCSATKSPAGSMRRVRTLASFSACTNPRSANTCKYWITAARVMARGAASCGTVMGPSLSFSVIARRVGSPRALKTRPMSGFSLPLVCDLWRPRRTSPGTAQPIGRVGPARRPQQTSAASSPGRRKAANARSGVAGEHPSITKLL